MNGNCCGGPKVAHRPHSSTTVTKAYLHPVGGLMMMILTERARQKAMINQNDLLLS